MRGRGRPAQRTARNDVSVFSNDCTFAWLIGSVPFTQVHSFFGVADQRRFMVGQRRVSLCTSSGLNLKIASSCH